MALSDGDDFVNGDLVSYQQCNRLKNAFRGAAAPTNPQPGMTWSSSSDEKFKHYQAAAWKEILQADTPFGDDNQIILGDNSDSKLIGYDETTNDAVIWGIPITPSRGLIFCRTADIAQDITALITASSYPMVSFLDADYDSYFAIDWDSDDLPEFRIGGVATKLYFNLDFFTDRWLAQDSNTFVGIDVCGSNNLAHGSGSEGYQNTAYGANSIKDITTGHNNCAFGFNSMTNLTSGIGNHAFGSYALAGLTDGDNNMAMGRYCLFQCNGDDNLGIGAYAGYTISTGNYNICLGSRAGYYTSTGVENVAIGFYSMFLNTTANYIVSVGSYALYGANGAITAFADAGGGQVTVTSANHGLENGMTVRISGTTNYNGSYTIANVSTNTFEITETWNGDDGTGNWKVSATASNNVGIGYKAGYQIANGDQNVFVGYQAGDSCKTGQGNVIIGYDKDVSASDADNEVVLGSLLTKTDSGLDIIYGSGVLKKQVNWDDASPITVCNVADGYVVVDAWIEIETTFDGDAVIVVGDGGNPDGFLDDAGINQGVAGYYGQEIDERGDYLYDSVNGHPIQKIYTGADTIDITITETTATQGIATVYIHIIRLK